MAGDAVGLGNGGFRQVLFRGQLYEAPLPR